MDLDYQEKLRLAKEALDSGFYDKETIEYIFPELRESEVEQEEDVELTDFESALFSAFSDAWQGYLLGKEVNVAKWAREHSAELLEIAREQKLTWSEEDEKILNSILNDLSQDVIPDDEDIQWLKSLKERMKGE